MAGWFRVDNNLIDDNTPARIGPAASLVLLVLMRYADSAGKCWPSGKTIAKHTGLSPRHVWECTERLEQFGLIYREQEPGKPTTYHVLGYEPGCTTKTGCEQTYTGVAAKPQLGLCENEHSGCEQTGTRVVNQRAYKEDLMIKTYEKDKKSAGKPAAVPGELLQLIDGWNALGLDIVLPGNGARKDPPAKAVLAGWNRAQRNREQRAALQDIPAVLASIRKAQFCHAKGWFSLPWLFATNKAGEFNIVRVVNGAHNGDGAANGPVPKPEKIVCVNIRPKGVSTR